MTEPVEYRRLSVRLNVDTRVGLVFNADGEGDVVSVELLPAQMLSPRDVTESLDADNCLHLLDRKRAADA